LWLVNAKTGRHYPLHQVEGKEDANIFAFAWSPDGKQIALIESYGLDWNDPSYETRFNLLEVETLLQRLAKEQ
jgi:hypothetical protein